MCYDQSSVATPLHPTAMRLADAIPHLSSRLFPGVVSGVEDDRRTTAKSNSSAGSYHIYAMPTQPFSHGEANGGTSRTNGTIELTASAEGVLVGGYEFPVGTRTTEAHGYYEVEDLEESMKSVTLASQYEVPVSSTLSSEVG